MAKCNQCLHKYVCEMRTCAECVSSYCDECQLYCENDGRKPDIENCEYFLNEEKPFNVVKCEKCQYSYWEKESETSSALKCGNPNGLFDEINFNDFCSYGKGKD